ncbi:MAG: enoate reductase, partial [Clostridia bacterium]
LPENIENPMDKLKPLKYQPKTIELDADIVVVAAGVASENKIYYDCVKQNVANEIYNVGDSFKGGRVFEAVRASYRKARNV